MSDERLRAWLRTHDPTPQAADDEPVTVLDEMDVLYDERLRRGDPRWFPASARSLTRLAHERRPARYGGRRR